MIVDFRGLKNGTVLRMVNTAPDAPFGGFPDIPADPATTGQVMQFVVNSALLGDSPTDPTATDPYSLVLNAEPANTAPIAAAKTLSLNEEESGDTLRQRGCDGQRCGSSRCPPAAVSRCASLTGGVPMAPKAALLGEVHCVDELIGALTVTFLLACNLATEVLAGVSMLWSEPMTERPIQGDTEQWDIYNLTVDGHPIHLHLVRYEVVDRQLLDPITNLPIGLPMPPEANETGYKDTVSPTRVRSPV